jgi:hypothetical protein
VLSEEEYLGLEKRASFYNHSETESDQEDAASPPVGKCGVSVDITPLKKKKKGGMFPRVVFY